MLFRSCCVAPQAPPVAASASATMASRRKDEEDEEELNPRHSLHKMFSRDAMPLPTKPNSSPATLHRLFSRDTISAPSPVRLTRFLSRGAVMESSTPNYLHVVNRKRPLGGASPMLGGGGSLNDEDFEEVQEVLDGEGLGGGPAIILHREINFEPTEGSEEVEGERCYGVVFKISFGQELVRLGQVEITGMSLMGELELSPIRVYSTLNVQVNSFTEVEWTRANILLGNGKLRTPLTVNSQGSCLVYISSVPQRLLRVYHSITLLREEDEYLQVRGLGINSAFALDFTNALMDSTKVGQLMKLEYTVRTVRWSPTTHLRFPIKFQQSVFALLLALGRSHGGIPTPLLLHVFALLPYDWFG
ncbi:hypothetical protein BASA81_014009 [Batrachochytrium salamandrivorans]|nr:hypothetical protein BASA81_014009 [Batrachochytrium salamandrivorans]